MINIAIVEDEESCKQKLKKFLERYEHDSDQRFNYILYSDGNQIIANYKAQFDIILMDVKMRYMDGMTTAKKIRKVDPEVVIIFITETPQYAIEGYTVDALDYVLKPVSYFAFTQRLQRAIKRISLRGNKYTTIIFKGGAQKLNIENIYYIEIANHTLTYHAESGKYTTSGTLRSVEEKLVDVGFFRCHRCYLVNLHHVEGIRNNYAIINGEKVLISRSRKSAFLEALTDCMREV